MARSSKKLRVVLPTLLRVFRKLWPAVRREKGLLQVGFLATAGGVVLRLLEPWPLKFVFDRVIPIGAAAESTSGLNPLALCTLAAVAVVAIALLRAIADYWSRVAFALVGNKALMRVRNRVYRHLQSLSLGFHARARTGDLVVRVIGDTNRLKDIAVTAVMPLLVGSLVMVGMVAVMSWMNARLALLAAAVIPLFWLSTVRLGRRIHDAARKQRQREGALAATAAESMTAIESVQALSLESVFDQQFASRAKKGMKEGVKTSRLSAALERSVDVLVAIGSALVLWGGARLILRGDLTPGDLIVFLVYLKRAFRPARQFAKYTGRLAQAAAAGERVLELLDRAPEVRDGPHAVEAPPLQGAVGFENVTFSYDEGQPVIRDVTLAIPRGACVALTGRSGAGKSTLLGLLLRLYDPDRGRVRFDGRDVRDLTVASVRRQVGVVPQDAILFAATARENIAFGAPDATDDDVEAAARLANADGFLRALPDGYGTELGERGATLSRGQNQRIAIARAAIRRSPLFLLDEPTTGLDDENARTVIDAVLRLAGGGRTTVIATHDLRLAARADLVVVLERGRVIESGVPGELLAREDGRFLALHRLWAAEEAV